ncbi:MAG: tRNA (guanosine(46)-N7)-methyltransferase TrmB [Bacteroidetes bacterium]|nr:tRNA (guanosine(46)-N7)-methyltransferase TrmB [Bacteroidota bacterium]MDA1269401.1 tRNA (guanosine(46)-N7)-methyltransferase TrmB [Bacteroidota bacterium]
MSRKKLVRFAQNEVNPNVVQAGKPIFEQLKGQWNILQFTNDQPLVVELACGRGEFTVGLGRQYPNQNFIGVDIKGSRIWKGSSSATAEGIHNVAFLRTQIQQLENFFATGEITELWITFPDPFPRDGDEKRRLTSPKFLEMYKQLLKAGGIIHFKTDNTGLYEYTELVLSTRSDCQILNSTPDFYESDLREVHYGIKTRYEKIFSDKGEKIKYIQFSFTE